MAATKLETRTATYKDLLGRDVRPHTEIRLVLAATGEPLHPWGPDNASRRADCEELAESIEAALAQGRGLSALATGYLDGVPETMEREDLTTWRRLAAEGR